MPRLKLFLEDMPGVPCDDLWTDIPPINSQAQERLGYPTQKPEALLERMIKASSNEGDVILDAYCGCGTTVAVAERLKRNWIGMDVTYQAIALILKRLEDAFGKDVVSSVRLSGVPKDMASATALAHKADDRTRKEFEKWARPRQSISDPLLRSETPTTSPMQPAAGRGRTDDKRESRSSPPGLCRYLRYQVLTLRST